MLQRSNAAIILTRLDPPPAAGRPTSSGRGWTRADDSWPRGRRWWPMVLTWIVLGTAIMALWALLLLGDSLVVSG